MLVGLTGSGMAVNGISMKLQFAAKGTGTCTAPTGTYADVTTSTVVAYNNNATPADGAAATSNANDPTSSNTIRKQTYEEANNFTNSQLGIASGEDGMWDFSLIDLDMPASTTYCLRMVVSDNTAFTTYSQYPEITSAANYIDRSVDATGVNHQGTSPTTVFTSDLVGYTFYVDSTFQGVYRKTTDGGVTWGSTVIFDTQTDVINVAVWYDQWTPGDSSGTNIHIMTADTGNDDVWYTRLDTATDTLTTPVSANNNTAQAGALTSGGTFASITKGTNGILYIGVVDNLDVYAVECSATCTTATNWIEQASVMPFLVVDGSVTLLPLASGNIMAISWNRSEDDLESSVYNDTTNTWASIVDIDITHAENTTYIAGYGATLNRTTNDIYLTAVEDATTLGTDDDVVMYTYSAGTWTQNTDILTNSARGVLDAKIAFDENTDDLYAIYSARTTAATATTGTIYYKISTDGGATWGGEQGPVSIASTDLYGGRVNISSDERIYLTYMDNATDDLLGVTIADLVPTVPPYTEPSFVQSEINASTTSQTATSVTLGSAVTAGNLIVVAVSLWNTNSDAVVSSVTDNKGNTYQLAVDDPVGQNGGVEPLAIYYAYNVAGGSSFQVTVNTAGAASFVTVAATEYAGIATINPLDKTAATNALGGAASTAGDSGATATTTTDYELVFGACNHLDADTTATAGTNFTMREFNNDNSNSETLYTEDRFVTTKGTYNATMTFAANRQWRCGVATFKAADSPPNSDQLMRHGGYFNNSGAKHKFIF
jgi:hypothetical protein